MPSEHREAPRVPVILSVRYWRRGQEEAPCRSLDLSASGMFLEEPGELTLGEEVEVAFALKVGGESARIHCTGQVIRVLSRERAAAYGLIPGVAIEFGRFLKGKAQLHQFIEQQLGVAGPAPAGKPAASAPAVTDWGQREWEDYFRGIQGKTPEPSATRSGQPVSMAWHLGVLALKTALIGLALVTLAYMILGLLDRF